MNTLTVITVITITGVTAILLTIYLTPKVKRLVKYIKSILKFYSEYKYTDVKKFDEYRETQLEINKKKDEYIRNLRRDIGRLEAENSKLRFPLIEEKGQEQIKDKDGKLFDLPKGTQVKTTEKPDIMDVVKATNKVANEINGLIEVVKSDREKSKLFSNNYGKPKPKYPTSETPPPKPSEHILDAKKYTKEPDLDKQIKEMKEALKNIKPKNEEDRTIIPKTKPCDRRTITGPNLCSPKECDCGRF